jgi:hypothetical protein
VHCGPWLRTRACILRVAGRSLASFAGRSLASLPSRAQPSHHHAGGRAGAVACRGAAAPRSTRVVGWLPSRAAATRLLHNLA